MIVVIMLAIFIGDWIVNRRIIHAHIFVKKTIKAGNVGRYIHVVFINISGGKWF